MTILCLASYEKGQDFLREAKRQGSTVLLVTSLSLKDKVNWPVASIDDIFYMPDTNHAWDRQQVLDAMSWLARGRAIDRVVALDDFDVEVAAMIREHLRIPGIGDTQVRYFRDKLAMRGKAQECGILVPGFVGAINYNVMREFMNRTPAPWLLKPRSMAGAIGIKKLYRQEELWPVLDQLGDMQSHYLLEQFVPGDIYHVDTIVHKGVIRFAIASGYGRPPLDVSHEGGVFTTQILERDSDVARELLDLNTRVMSGFRLEDGVSHTEYIHASADQQLYFLETSARVGGAHIPELIEAATGLNLWREWAKVECSRQGAYEARAERKEYAGLLVSLARQQWPDTSAYNDPEIVWRMQRENHVGLIVRSPSADRVRELLTSYVARVQRDFYAFAPPLDKPAH